jgi:hypothetical protein
MAYLDVIVLIMACLDVIILIVICLHPMALKVSYLKNRYRKNMCHRAKEPRINSVIILIMAYPDIMVLIMACLDVIVLIVIRLHPMTLKVSCLKTRYLRNRYPKSICHRIKELGNKCRRQTGHEYMVATKAMDTSPQKVVTRSEKKVTKRLEN